MATHGEHSARHPAIDQYNFLRLPPELKQEHGDGIIMTADSDVELQNELMEMIFDVGNLEDKNPPNVVPLDDACIWVQNIIDNLAMSMKFYTLLFCIITDDLLKSRHFADTAILDILEQRQDTFIPVYRNKEEYNRMKTNQIAKEKLPAIYKLVKPVFLNNNSRNGRAHTVKQLRSLFNYHLSEKLNRIDYQERVIKEALEQMKSQNQITDNMENYSISSHAIEPHSMQHSVATQSDRPTITCDQSNSLNESVNLLSLPDNSGTNKTRLELEAESACNEVHIERPPTVLQTREEPTQKLLSQSGDLSIDGELQSETKTPIEATDHRVKSATSQSINTFESTNEKSLHFNFETDSSCNSEVLALNARIDNQRSQNNMGVSSELDKVGSNHHGHSSKSNQGNCSNSQSIETSNWRVFGTGLAGASMGVAVGAAVVYAVLKSK